MVVRHTNQIKQKILCLCIFLSKLSQGGLLFHIGLVICLTNMLNYLVLRLQPTVPLALNSKDEVDMFFDGKLPKLASTITDIAVVGMFLDKNDKGTCLKPGKTLNSQSASLHSGV